MGGDALTDVTVRAWGSKIGHSVLLGANRVQKVGIFAETVTVFTYIVKNAPLAFKIPIPLVRAIVWFRRLQTAQNTFIVISDSCDFLDSDGAVKRIVGIEAIWIWFWLDRESIGRNDIFWGFQVNLEHFSEQYSILILNLTHAFCKIYGCYELLVFWDLDEDLPKFCISRFALFFKWLALRGLVICIVGLIYRNLSICITWS